MKIEAVIFDVDGTLWNTTELVSEAWNRAAFEFGIQNMGTVTGDILKREFGKPMDIIADDLFPGVDEDIKSELLKQCCQYEQEILEKADESMLYPGVEEVFKRLDEQCRIFVVSNCQSGYIELFLEKNKLRQYVTDIECYGNTLLSKGENIKLVMERNHIQNAVYVGDTIGDYEAAVYAGIPFIFAKYGFGSVTGAWKEVTDIRQVLELEEENHDIRSASG